MYTADDEKAKQMKECKRAMRELKLFKMHKAGDPRAAELTKKYFEQEEKHRKKLQEAEYDLD